MQGGGELARCLRGTPGLPRTPSFDLAMVQEPFRGCLEAAYREVEQIKLASNRRSLSTTSRNLRSASTCQPHSNLRPSLTGVLEGVDLQKAFERRGGGGEPALTQLSSVRVDAALSDGRPSK